jgi:uncharacterized membrane protein
MKVPEYEQRSSLVRTLYESSDPREAWMIAKRLRISYLYVDAIDRQAYAGTGKFDRSPEYFRAVFSHGAVGVYQVR